MPSMPFREAQILQSAGRRLQIRRLAKTIDCARIVVRAKGGNTIVKKLGWRSR